MGNEKIKRILIAAILVFATVSAVSAISVVSCIAGSRGRNCHGTSAAADGEYSRRYYKSIHIQEGDTLLSIARTYNDGSFYDDPEYVEQIKKVNRIQYDDIHPGCYLVVIDFKQ
jgi:hypothetical protein